MGEHPADPFVVHLTGELDAAGAPGQIGEPVMRALAEGHRYVVLDFFHVRFIDSTAMSVLLAMRSGALDRGGRLVSAHITPEIQRFFDLTGHRRTPRESARSNADPGAARPASASEFVDLDVGTG